MQSEVGGKVERHLKTTCFKGEQAPSGVKPVLKAWMELTPDGRAAQEQGKIGCRQAERGATDLCRNQRLGHDTGEPTQGSTGTDKAVPSSMCCRLLCAPHLAVVLQEIALAPAWAAARMVRAINQLAPVVLEPSVASEELADAYVRAGIVPARKRDDARHVAIATVAGLEIVVSWNHRHLANERKAALFGAINRLAGYEQVLLIHTPFELMP